MSLLKMFIVVKKVVEVLKSCDLFRQRGKSRPELIFLTTATSRRKNIFKWQFNNITVSIYVNANKVAKLL